MRTWRVVGRHGNWVSGGLITELHSEDHARFVAQVDGWGGFYICEVSMPPPVSAHEIVEYVKKEVRTAQARIRTNDKTVFHDWRFSEQGMPRFE